MIQNQGILRNSALLLILYRNSSPDRHSGRHHWEQNKYRQHRDILSEQAVPVLYSQWRVYLNEHRADQVYILVSDNSSS